MKNLKSVFLALAAILATSALVHAAATTANERLHIKAAIPNETLADRIADELDYLDEVTASSTELNYGDVAVAGVAEANKAVVLDSVKAVTGMGHIAPAAGTTFTTADPNPSLTTLRANAYFLVDTTANAVDLDFSNDADLAAADLGKRWTFVVSAGGTNALTVTDGASGVLVKLQAAAGATCEDPGDRYECVAYALEAVSCTSFCAD